MENPLVGKRLKSNIPWENAPQWGSPEAKNQRETVCLKKWRCFKNMTVFLCVCFVFLTFGNVLEKVTLAFWIVCEPSGSKQDKTGSDWDGFSMLKGRA